MGHGPAGNIQRSYLVMQLRLTPLASGSKGNSSLLEWDTGKLLIDCGVNIKTLTERLAQLGVAPTELDAVLVTHEHSDHIGGAGPLGRRFKLPIFLTAGTMSASDGRLDGVQLTTIADDRPFSLNGLTINPFAVPHDARETVAFTFHPEGAKPATGQLGYLTDAGHVTPHMLTALAGCTHLALEANHCPQLLRDGPYPFHLKRRVSGFYGHLSNIQAAHVAAALAADLEEVRLMHLSEQNNTPELAIAAVKSQLRPTTNLLAATQHAPVAPLARRW